MVFTSPKELKTFKKSKMFFNFYPKNIKNNLKSPKKSHSKEYKQKIVWFNVIALSALHLVSFYGVYLLLIAWKCRFYNIIFQILWTISASFGITGGAHRLWAHKSYKAKTPLKIIYAILMSMTFANDIYSWVRDHRAHHKFTETNADPHNAKRGFFFSHCGWLLVKKHPDVLKIGGTICYQDLKEDPVVMFHKKYYPILMPLGTFIIPTFIPWYFWNQESSIIFSILRYIINIHIVWSLNSFAHLYGAKPYDNGIYARENTPMMYITIGEGFHNYHHVFPWDYKAAEFGDDKRNLTTYLINLFAKIGWATELKMASEDMIKKRVLRTGDGSWQGLIGKQSSAQNKVISAECKSENVWGWDDPDVTKDMKTKVMVQNMQS